MSAPPTAPGPAWTEAADDLPRYLARRLFALYPVELDPSVDQLESVCAARGFPIVRDPRLDGKACCVPDPLAILLGERAGRRKLGHELFHAWTYDNRAHGIEYAADWWRQEDEETAARRFEAYLFRPRSQPTDTLRGFRLRPPEPAPAPWRRPSLSPPPIEPIPAALLAAPGERTRFGYRLPVLRRRRHGSLAEGFPTRGLFLRRRPRCLAAARSAAAALAAREAALLEYCRRRFGLEPPAP